MLHQLFSDDFPRSRALTAILIVIVAVLVCAPFLFSRSVKSLHVAGMICVFIVLVASFDLLLGYTGIVSFAHTLFFGFGAYGVAIAITRMGPTWMAIGVGSACALALSVAVSLLTGAVSLRVRRDSYAMVTLAVAVAFQTLAIQLSDITGGDDGLPIKVPPVLSPQYLLSDRPVLGAMLTGRTLAYYLVFAAAVAMFFVMLRIVNSPFGRVLQAIRDNEFRAEAIGYRPVIYRTLSNVAAAAFATLAGALLALWISYNGPDTSLSFQIMLDILLMIVIGGMGTLYGAVIGAVALIAAQSYLQDLIGVIGKTLARLPLAGGVVSALFAPDRWMLWLGVLFVISVYFFPAGMVGELRKRDAKREIGRT